MIERPGRGPIHIEANSAEFLTQTTNLEDFLAVWEELPSLGVDSLCLLPHRWALQQGAIDSLKETRTKNGLPLVAASHEEAAGMEGSPIVVANLGVGWNPFVRHYPLPVAIVLGAFNHFVVRKAYGDIARPQLNKAVGRELFPKVGRAPIEQDGFFPSVEECKTILTAYFEAFPQAKLIHHEFEFDFRGRDWLFKFYPGQVEDLDGLLAKIDARTDITGVVIDPLHSEDLGQTISRSGQPVQPYYGDWEKNIERIGPRVKGVDIHPLEDMSIRKWLNGGYLERLAEATGGLINLEFYRIEAAVFSDRLSRIPHPFFKDKNRATFSQIVERLSR